MSVRRVHDSKISYTVTENEMFVSNNIELIRANFVTAKYTPKKTHANLFAYS